MIQEMVQTAGNFLAGDIAMTLYWCAAIGGTVFFLFALLFSSFEISGVDSPDVAADGTFDSMGHVDTGFADFQFISMKSIFAFVTMFGWTGVVWGNSGWGGFFAALLVGLVAMFLTALAIWMMLKLQHSGNIMPGEMVGLSGTVYMTIPAGRVGMGKVTVAVHGATCEVNAVADEVLPTGTAVKLVKALEPSKFLAEKV